MTKPVVKYVCQNCGYTSLRWIGKCPDCSSWNSFVEEIIPVPDKRKISSKSQKSDFKFDNLAKLSEIDVKIESRLKTGISELDRVLGGGIVSGSVILVG
jgi:DNA repair protein RadA/Sms